MENELMIADSGFVGQLTSRTASFSSMRPVTEKEKAAAFNAMNNPDKRLKDMINMTIKAKDLYCETVTIQNKETGEVQDAPRIVIIDDKGVSYQCVSIGIFSALKKLMAPEMFGLPTWDPPIKLTVKNIDKGTRSILTLNIAE